MMPQQRKAETYCLHGITIAILAAILIIAKAPIAVANDETWQDIRASLYGSDRVIHDGEGVIKLDAPDRALDAATVPISVTAEMEQTEEHYIRAVTLVIDENPAPVVGTFHLFPGNGIANISTRVRVNAYTNIRAIAETSDGELYMAQKFVKASGGCSAPASKDHDLAMARLGKMRLKQIGAWRKGEPAEGQFMISHPNYSGMQIDQVTQLWIPARYVRSIELTLGDKPILRFEGDISMSENPMVRFFVRPDAEAELHAKVVDSDEKTFEQSWPIELDPAS
ncbi:quinoprotein dehydrogenase-associated SoxYZ-like carrier [Chelativorans salis]|uniref:Quinoprotein dehydrogenase-associated SoxYZ-like carrier n=1 Tax=Chelativorans salis TaxID=2978478 RepID=A0ABT2LI98_9HYPH|nr:quinoprotein dehydrogenase-associated SoxYZ-like carrier [Chelativorans sp. EGI FJ00035]MCT7374285.1 quinoprotein dehydrogenase-associated SoxYZ-like carrier [Chelativorans sp. EGI FJ00035]